MTTWRYLCADVRTVFLLAGFLTLSSLAPLVILGAEGVYPGIRGGWVDLMLLAGLPLILSAIVLLDVVFAVRAINRSISEGRFARASIVSISPSDLSVFLVMSVRLGAKSFRKFVLLFPQSRTRVFAEGAFVSLPEYSLVRLRSPIPIEAIFEERELSDLLPKPSRDMYPSSRGSVAPRERKIGAKVLLLTILFFLVVLALFAPVPMILFRRLEGMGVVLAQAIYVVSAIVISVSQAVKTLHRDSIVVLADGLSAFGDDGPQFFKWSEIEEVLVRRVVGFRYFAIYSQDRKIDAWVPFFLQDFDGFLADVAREALEGNPLRTEVETMRVARKSGAS